LGTPDPRRDLERVKAAPEALGDDILLIIDADQVCRVHEALEFAQKIRDYNIFWLEEPVPKDDLRATRA
jgi:L-alanine-DL-glutamate epimerase-like enolase superfamily enzyme